MRLSLLVLPLLALACGDDPDTDLSTTSPGGAGPGGSSAAGTSSGSSGQGGQAGSASGASGQGGAAGPGGAAGAGGAGHAGQGGSLAGSAGSAGLGGAGAAAGEGGAGQGGLAGAGGAGAAGEGPGGQAGGGAAGGGAAGGGAGGVGGMSGSSGQSGAAGSGVVGGSSGAAGSSGAGGSGAGAGATAGAAGGGGGVAGTAGGAGTAGKAGNGGAAGAAGASGAGQGGAGAAGSSVSGAAGVSGGSGQGGQAGACGAIENAYPLEPSPHVPFCTPLTFTTNPPSSGNHYSPGWAQFKSYKKVVPRGFWVHSMEHGAVAFLYRCADDCSADVAKLQAIADAFPADPLCAGTGATHRIVIVPDPKLSTRFAAAAWGYTLTASCLDEAALASFQSFLTAHYAKTPEDFCSGGVDYDSVDLPASCGEPGYTPLNRVQLGTWRRESGGRPLAARPVGRPPPTPPSLRSGGDHRRTPAPGGRPASRSPTVSGVRRSASGVRHLPAGRPPGAGVRRWSPPERSEGGVGGGLPTARPPSHSTSRARRR